jgi:hypothetical protein
MATTAVGPPPPWRNSPAKKLLERLYRDKQSWIHLCLPEQIYATEPLFKQYPWNNFRNKVNRLMDTLDLEEEQVEFDRLALEKYRNKARPALTKRGEPFWDGHAAEGLLKEFVKTQDEQWKNGQLQRKKLPAELHGSQDAYKAFSLETFRNHYYGKCGLCEKKCTGKRNAIEMDNANVIKKRSLRSTHNDVLSLSYTSNSGCPFSMSYCTAMQTDSKHSL